MGRDWRVEDPPSRGSYSWVSDQDQDQEQEQEWRKYRKHRFFNMSAQRQKRENPDLVQHGLTANTDGKEEKAFLVTNGYHRLPQVTTGYRRLLSGYCEWSSGYRKRSLNCRSVVVELPRTNAARQSRRSRNPKGKQSRIKSARTELSSACLPSMRVYHGGGRRPWVEEECR